MSAAGEGRIDVVGLGPGRADWITPATTAILAAATDLIGYGPYLARLDPLPHQTLHASDNGVELDRARKAIALARAGRRVAVVSGGDPGVFAMAAAVLEAVDIDGVDDVAIEVHPGISAMQAASARLGAMLGHDFCAINLSDNLKRFGTVLARLTAAAEADFVIALYNPASRARPDRIHQAFAALRAVKPAETVVAFARAIGRPDEAVTVTTLGAADPAVADMATLVLIGSTATRALPGGTVYTPRCEPLRTDDAADTAPWLTLIGLGEDGLAGLTSAARRALFSADILIGGARHLALVPDTGAARWVWPSPISGLYGEILAARGRRVVVLATGDPFHHGIGSVLAGLVDPAEMRVFPAPSAFSLACARLGWAEQDCVTLSLHGRAFERVIPHLVPGRRLLILSWDETTPARLAAHLTAQGFGPSRLVVLDALGGAGERITDGTAAAFGPAAVTPLNLVALEVKAAPDARLQPRGFGLPDDLFAHDGQITKREVRAVTLSALAPRGHELLWDIGGGSGSVAIEWMLADPFNRAIAVEQDAGRAARIADNARNFGVPGLTVITGRAPDVLADLPPPDAIFVGGGGSDAGLIDALWARLPPGGRIVVNAVTIEAEAEMMRRFQAHGGDLIRIGIERAAPIGTMSGFAPARAITQWRGRKS